MGWGVGHKESEKRGIMRTRAFLFHQLGHGDQWGGKVREIMKGLKQPCGRPHRQMYQGRAPRRGHEHTSSGLAGFYLFFKVMKMGIEEIAQ